jgi:cell division septum initiation protein DivIVA
MSTIHEAVTVGPTDGASEEPTRLLELAVHSADQLLAEARADAERVTAAARAEADQILASARNEAELVLVALKDAQRRVQEDVALLRQARWARHEQLPEQAPSWLAEGAGTEAG